MSSTSIDPLVTPLDAPLIVVTTTSRDQLAGCIVGFHSQCSIDPVRYAVWLSKANYTYRVALLATHLAVHMLDAGDRPILQLFGGTSGDDTDKFALCDWAPGPGGVPLLARCPNRVVLERTSLSDDGGDHVCFVGTPVEVEAPASFSPMRVSDATDIVPGHEAGERATATAPDAGRRAGRDRAASMDDEERRRLENAAAGAGHAVDLSSSEPFGDDTTG